MLTDDGRNIHGLTTHAEEGQEEYVWRREEEGGQDFVWPPHTKVKVEEMVHDAFQRADELQGQRVPEEENAKLPKLPNGG